MAQPCYWVQYHTWNCYCHVFWPLLVENSIDNFSHFLDTQTNCTYNGSIVFVIVIYIITFGIGSQINVRQLLIIITGFSGFYGLNTPHTCIHQKPQVCLDIVTL